MYYYQIQLSNSAKVVIDETELAAVQVAISRRSPMVVCKRGIFNAAFYVAITPARELNEQERYKKDVGLSEPEEFPMIPAADRKLLGK